MNLKKIFSALTAISIIGCMQSGVFGSGINDFEKINRVKSLDIMKGYDDGSFGEENSLTRAEFAAVICRILNSDNTLYSSSEKIYTDVPEEHWAFKNINLVTDLKYMQGFGNGLFMPEECITYNQAITVFIKILGYDIACDAAEGDDFYSPYVRCAGTIGILKGLNFGADNPINRSELAKLICSALDTRLMTVGSDGASELSDYTLLDKFKLDGDELEGIVQESGFTYLVNDNDLENDEVIIDDCRYNIGDTNADEYLGMKVHFFVKNLGNDNFAISGIYPDKDNEVITLSGDDVTDYDGSYLTYEDENGKKKRVNVSGSRLVCNGRIYNGSAREIVTAPNARIKLINNDSDKDFDYIFTEVYELAQISKNNAVNGTIYLQSTLKNGSRTIEYQNDDLNLSFINVEGEDINPEKLVEKDAWLEIYSSQDGKNIKVIELGDKKIGYVEQISLDDSGAVRIDGEEYLLAKDYAGFLIPPRDLVINNYYEYYLDSFGEIIYVEKKNETSKTHYGYLSFVPNSDDGDSEEKIVVKLVNGTTVKNYKENEKYYIHGNNRQEAEKFTVAPRVKIDDKYYSNASDIRKALNDVSYDEYIGSSKIGNVIRYALNDKNEINRIEIMTPYGKFTSRKLNAEQMILGGDDTPFGIADDTIVFFIPSSNMDDDVSCEMKFSADSYKTIGYELDDEKYTVSAIVFESPLSVYDNSDFAETERTKIVQAVSQVINENGELVYRVSGYAGNDVFNRITRSNIEAVDSVVSNLKRGDIVQFQTDFDGQINKIKQSISVEINDEYYHSGAQTSHEVIYGIASDSIGNYLGVGSTEYVNQLTIALDETGLDETTYQFPIKASTAPDIYVYYTDKKTVMPGDFDDIITMNKIGSEYASRVMLYASNSVVKSILIIK